MFVGTLDPEDTSNVTGDIEPDELLIHLRNEVWKFGYLPNVAHLRPGDLVLTSGDGWLSKRISEFQRRHIPTHAIWTHAAMYVGGFHVIEAVPFYGVSWNTIDRYVPTKKMLFRRPTILFEDRSPDDYVAKGYRAALHAAYHRGFMTYGFLTAAEMGLIMLDINRRPLSSILRLERESKSFICSTLYANCILDGAGQRIAPGGELPSFGLMTPGYLAASTKLKTLDVGWARLPNEL